MLAKRKIRVILLAVRCRLLVLYRDPYFQQQNRGDFGQKAYKRHKIAIKTLKIHGNKNGMRVNKKIKPQRDSMKEDGRFECVGVL